MTSTEQQPDPPAHEPVTTTRWRAVLLASVAACAACGIIYELALLTLSTSLNGGGIIATSLIVAGYIAALGAGACWSSRYCIGLQSLSSQLKHCWPSSADYRPSRCT